MKDGFTPKIKINFPEYMMKHLNNNIIIMTFCKKDCIYHHMIQYDELK